MTLPSLLETDSRIGNVPWRNFLLDHFTGNTGSDARSLIIELCFENTSTDGIEDLLDYFVKAMHADGRDCVVFSNSCEAFSSHSIELVDRVIAPYLEHKHGIDPSRIGLGFGNHPTAANRDFYYSICAANGWLPRSNVWFQNMLEHNHACYLRMWPELYAQIDTAPRIKGKSFVCWNRIARPNRLGLIAWMLRLGILDRGYVSCVRFDQNHVTALAEQNHRRSAWMQEIISANLEKFPLLLTLDPDEEITHDIRRDLDHVRDSYVNIVTETKFYRDTPHTLHCNVHLDCHAITEKTFKAISAKQPFIITGMPGILGHVRSLGYRTFAPWIDESYDSIEDDEDRLAAIAMEIYRLSQQSDAAWLEMQQGWQQILEHNFNRLADATYRFVHIDQIG